MTREMETWLSSRLTVSLSYADGAGISIMLYYMYIDLGAKGILHETSVFSILHDCHHSLRVPATCEMSMS